MHFSRKRLYNEDDLASGRSSFRQTKKIAITFESQLLYTQPKMAASFKLLFAVLGLVLLADHCLGATIRDGMGRQMDFDPSAEPAEGDAAMPPPQSRGFIQRIFEMIKNFLGMGETRTTVMRSDGTIEEVDLPGGGNGGGGFISRIGKRLMGFINTILSVITGDNGSPRLDGYSARGGGGGTQGISNDIERELMKMVRGA